MRNAVTSIVCGSRRTTVGWSAGSAWLSADHAVPCDWSKASSTPQPNGSPESSLTTSMEAPPLSAAQSRVMRTSCVVVVFPAITTFVTISRSYPAEARNASFGYVAAGTLGIV